MLDDLDYSADFTKWLIDGGYTLIDVDVFVSPDSALIVSPAEISGALVTVEIAGGTVGVVEQVKLQLSLVDASGDPRSAAFLFNQPVGDAVQGLSLIPAPPSTRITTDDGSSLVSDDGSYLVAADTGSSLVSDAGSYLIAA